MHWYPWGLYYAINILILALEELAKMDFEVTNEKISSDVCITNEDFKVLLSCYLNTYQHSHHNYSKPSPLCSRQQREKALPPFLMLHGMILGPWITLKKNWLCAFWYGCAHTFEKLIACHNFWMHPTIPNKATFCFGCCF